MSMSKRALERISYMALAVMVALAVMLAAQGCDDVTVNCPGAQADTTAADSTAADTTTTPPTPAPPDTSCGPPGPPCNPPQHNRGRGNGPK